MRECGLRVRVSRIRNETFCSVTCVRAPEGFSTWACYSGILGVLWPFPGFPSRFHSGIVEDCLLKQRRRVWPLPHLFPLASPPAWCLSLPCLSRTCDSSQPACPRCLARFLALCFCALLNPGGRAVMRGKQPSCVLSLSPVRVSSKPGV